MKRRFIAHITRIDDGETRDYQFDDEDPFNDYIWRDGNYCCDCNRGLFFGYAIGERPEDIETECGDSAFTVKISTPTGFIVYQDERES